MRVLPGRLQPDKVRVELRRGVEEGHSIDCPLRESAPWLFARPQSVLSACWIVYTV